MNCPDHGAQPAPTDEVIAYQSRDGGFSCSAT